MLTYQVSKLETGVYIRASGDEEGTLSVSGNQQITLHCAGDLTSDPFPFDAVVYAPFHNTLYTTCVSDNVRAQFGAAMQRPTATAATSASSRSAPRRCTLVHGDPVTHSTAAFYNVVRLAAEDVERIAGAHHAESPYECVFNILRVYPWGEQDLLREALRGEGEACPALWKEKTTVPLRTPAHRRLFLTVLKDMCRVPAAGERDESAACVQQVRLAVYAGGAARGEKLLCTEHLFSLVPSVGDVCRSFGTTMEALCEVLVCRREGNLLDNALLPVLLPGVAVDGLSVLTCISAQGRYASRACIDACCFGCSSDRERLVCAAASLRLEDKPAAQTSPQPRRPRNLFCPPTAPVIADSFQKMTGELLLSVAPRSHETTPQPLRTTQPTAAPTSVPPAATASPALSGRRTPSPLSHIDASVDRLLAHHPSPLPLDDRTPVSSPSAKVAPPQRTPLQSRLPFSPYELRRNKEKLALQAETNLREHVAEMEERAEAAVAAARVRAADARRREEAAMDKASALEEKMQATVHRYATEEAALLIRQRVLELSCTELQGRERQLEAAMEARQAVADGLTRAQREVAELEPRLAAMRAEEQLRSQNTELQQRFTAWHDATSGVYAAAVAEKLVMLDAHAHALAENVRLDAWETRLTALQRECAAQDARVAALTEQSREGQRRFGQLQREESTLRLALDGLRSECAQLEGAVVRLEGQREAQQQRIAADMKEAADAQEKALHDYDESIALLRRLKDEAQDLRAKRDAMRAECQQHRAERDAAKTEVDDVRVVLQQLHSEDERMRGDIVELKSELEELQATTTAAAAAAVAAVSVADSEETSAEESAARDRTSQETAAYDAAKATISDDLRALIEELADATEELADVEDGMMEETDKALLAFRRCDGELTLRVERLMDRCASFIDVESRLLSRAPSFVSRLSAHQRRRGGLTSGKSEAGK